MQHRVLRVGDRPGASEGCEVARGVAGRPDERGVLREYVLELPAMDVACYYAGAQKYGVDPARRTWPDGCNQIQPLKITQWEALKEGGIFAILQLRGGGYLVLLPVAGAESVAWLGGDGELVLRAGTLGTAEVALDLPLLAWARDDDLYAACERVWRAALACPLLSGLTQMRSAKRYPEALEYLGWCSWEEYRKDFNADKLRDVAAALAESDAPVRFVLVDDCHHDTRDDALLSFEPNDKFPDGWRALDAVRRVPGVDWLGLWLNFNGYWRGVATKNALGDLNALLTEVRPGMLLPKEDPLAAIAFYDQMLSATRDAGFDFVKVDNQAQNLALYEGRAANAARAAALNSRGLEIACGRHVSGLINCMAHNNTCAFGTRVSAVTRCSEDYLRADVWRAKLHLHDSFGNALWMGQTVWCDHDMFHSSDQVAADAMAISKALSGGPVYLSDHPRDFVRERIAPLCFDDGRVLRPIAPGVPLPDSVFCDPFAEALPYRVIAPLAEGAAAAAAYNLTHPEQCVRGRFTQADYRCAAGMLQAGPDAWPEADEGVLLFDWARRRAHALGDAPFEFELPAFGQVFTLLLPIRAGWAVVGDVEKYLAPVACKVLERSATALTLRTAESRPIWIWSPTPIACEAAAVAPAAENLHVVTPARDGPQTLRLSR